MSRDTLDLVMLMMFLFGFGVWAIYEVGYWAKITDSHRARMAVIMDTERKKDRAQVLKEIYYELRPFVIYGVYPYFVLYTTFDHNWFGLAIWSFNWYMDVTRRDGDDDDRWKKRRKKAASKVKQVAGKLVVVPVPAPS